MARRLATAVFCACKGLVATCQEETVMTGFLLANNFCFNALISNILIKVINANKAPIHTTTTTMRFFREEFFFLDKRFLLMISNPCYDSTTHHLMTEIKQPCLYNDSFLLRCAEYVLLGTVPLHLIRQNNLPHPSDVVVSLNTKH